MNSKPQHAMPVRLLTANTGALTDGLSRPVDGDWGEKGMIQSLVEGLIPILQTVPKVAQHLHSQREGLSELDPYIAEPADRECFEDIVAYVVYCWGFVIGPVIVVHLIIADEKELDVVEIGWHGVT